MIVFTFPFNILCSSLRVWTFPEDALAFCFWVIPEGLSRLAILLKDTSKFTFS
jgi:hypothetical protein